MKPNSKKNLNFNGRPYCIVELGDTLFFGGNVQQFYEVTGFDDRARPFHHELDLFQLEQDTKICPVVFS